MSTKVRLACDGLGRLNRGTRGGRPPGSDRSVHRRRNVVERCFNRLKHWRGLATRDDKTRESCRTTVTIASILLRIRPLKTISGACLKS
ncbi:transposase [Streptomyces sp. NPDC000931]|uniref:transposase n=1 Tax=Streptomyces sp. NPDC000931 TaxID=3154372 RepID=UPI00332510CD